MPTNYRDHTIQDAPPPKPKRRNIRSLPANRMEYLLENYPPDLRIPGVYVYKDEQGHFWSRKQVLKAMEAAYRAGRRDRNG